MPSLRIAALVVQSDFGITGLTFLKLRSHYLGEPKEASPDDQEPDGNSRDDLYCNRRHLSRDCGNTLVAGMVPVESYGVAYLPIFAGADCALPRMALRVAINARDGFVFDGGN
jgi:hypothetical protein